MTPRKLIYSLGHLVGILGAAWCFYCREWAQGIALLTGVGCLRFDPPEGSAPRLSSTLPIMCLASLAFGACGPANGPIDFCAGVHFKGAAPLQERAFISPQAQGLNGDYVRMTEQAALPSQCAGFGCVYTKSSDHLLRFADTSGNERIMGEASRLRSSAGTPADVALSWIWYDSGTDSVMARLSGGSVVLSSPGGPVTVDTAQTITGAKTFSAATVFNGSVTLGDAIADIIGVKGALRVYNAASTFYSEITPGATANRAVTLPDAAGAIVLDSASQTLTNKTVTSPTLSGTVAGTYNIGGTPTLTQNLAVSTTKTVTVGANVLIGAVADKLNGLMLAVASQAVGDILVADSTTTFARLAKGASDGMILTMVSGALAWATPSYVYAHFSGGGTGALGAATVYLTAPGQTASATERFLGLTTRASTARTLYCFLGTAPGGADTVVFTVRKGASDQALTCTVTGAATTCNDTTHTFSASAGDRLSVKAVSSAGTAADATCSFEEGN